MASSSTKSHVSQFNTTAKSFLQDLKNIFGEEDEDIQSGEVFMNITKVNARAILTPFYENITQNAQFVGHIMAESPQYFIDYNEYDTMMPESSAYLISKFKRAVEMHRDNRALLSPIFNWFKMLIYHSLNCYGIPAVEFMQKSKDLVSNKDHHA